MKKALILLLLLTLVFPYTSFSSASPVVENFTTYTEVDTANNRIIVASATHVDHVATRNEDTYLYKDFGASHFANFEHLVDAKADFSTGDGSFGYFWMLSNDLNDEYGLYLGSKTYIGALFYGSDTNKYVYIIEGYSGTRYMSSAYSVSANTYYYFKITKSGTVFTCKVYSDSARINLVATLSLTLHATHSFRYVFACNTYNDGQVELNNVDIDNLALQQQVYATLYYNTGGKFVVWNLNNVQFNVVTNGSTLGYENNTVLTLVAAPQVNYTFARFLVGATNQTTNVYNHTLIANITIWCYFLSATTFYNNGYNAGYAIGYSAGYSAGYVAGNSTGFILGNSTGYELGYDVGYTDGYAAGLLVHGTTVYISQSAIVSLPLNLIYYLCFTVLGLWLMTRNDKQAKYIFKILSAAMFVFMAIWVSEDSLLYSEVFYIQQFNSTSGNYTMHHETVLQTLPLTTFFLVLLNVALAIIPVIYLYLNTDK